jgi:endogenous inhibitor of DNA gyrase (YacG/DUF329 family)
LIDLNNWLAERYRISAPVEATEKEAPAENPAADTEGDRD